MHNKASKITVLLPENLRFYLILLRKGSRAWMVQ
ncbi:unnamed protein product [Arabidopsis halleri]